MNDAALYTLVSQRGAIETGTARAVIIPGRGNSWFAIKGLANPINTPTGIDQDYVAAATSSPYYRQAIE